MQRRTFLGGLGALAGMFALGRKEQPAEQPLAPKREPEPPQYEYQHRPCEWVGYATASTAAICLGFPTMKMRDYRSDPRG